MREIGMEKLRVGWGIRATRFEERGLHGMGGNIIRQCWKEKEEGGWMDRYGKERREYYNRNGLELEAVDRIRREGGELEVELLHREKETQKKWEEVRIEKSKYNERYKEIKGKGDGVEYLKKVYLEKEWIGDDVRALVKLRCGNMEEENKYWLGDKGSCLLCGTGKDCMEHYANECQIASS